MTQVNNYSKPPFEQSDECQLHRYPSIIGEKAGHSLSAFTQGILWHHTCVYVWGGIALSYLILWAGTFMILKHDHVGELLGKVML